MKTYMDRLREAPAEKLREMIERQKKQIETSRRDLEFMERALQEKVSATTCKTHDT